MKQKILLPDVNDLPHADRGIVPWLWFFAKPYRKTFYWIFLLRIPRFLAFALIPYVFSLMVDAIQSGWAFSHPYELWRNIAIVAFIYLVMFAVHIFNTFEALIIDKMQRALTMFSVNYMLRLPIDWHEQQGSGGKLQRIMQARANFREIYMIFTIKFSRFFIESAALIIAVYALNAPFYFLLLYAGYIGSYLFISWSMSKPIDRLNNQHNALKEKLVSHVYDFVSLIRMTKSFSLNDYVAGRSRDEEYAGHRVLRKARIIGYTKWTFMNLLVWFWGGLIVIFGLKNAMDKTITTGAFTALIFMAHRLWSFLEDMAMVQNDYLEYKSGFLRIRETLSTAVQNFDIAPVIDTPEKWDSIECHDLEFYYHADQPVLKHINLTIPRGHRIALIGHSGAGKSTMVKLLMKQVQPVGGDILIGDKSLKNIDSNDWLEHLALVPQDVELMNATLRENILLDQDEVNEEFYRECIRKAYLEEFVSSLPQGDRTEIGERGVKLSGGQKQRLGIARALARNAQIIIFDEATSSLDSESEAFIQRAMETAFVDKTVIVIAHRLSTIRHADMIYVFDKGVIAESGDFTTLEKSGGIFSRLWAMQSNGFIAN